MTTSDAIAPAPRPWTRLRARWFHRALDAELAAGRDPWSRPGLQARAAILVSLEHRRQVALSLRGLVRLAELGGEVAGFQHIRTTAIRAERETLVLLARRLYAVAPVPVAAVAQLTVLVQDDDSPIYDGGRPAEELTAVIRAVVLDPDLDPIPDPRRIR